MEDCLFKSLSKYPATESITPEENFFTNGFAFLLSSIPELAKKFVRFIDNDKIIGFTGPFEIKTQSPADYKKAIIDLVIEEKAGMKRAIYVEIKIGSIENMYDDETGKPVGQIEEYLGLREKPYVCFITLNHPDIRPVRKDYENRFLGQYEWAEIYKIIAKLEDEPRIKSNDKNQFLINQFLCFMKDKDMKPFEGFTGGDLNVLQKADFVSSFNKMFKFLEEMKNNKSIKSLLREIKGVKFSRIEYVRMDNTIRLYLQGNERYLTLAFGYENNKWNFYLWIIKNSKVFELLSAKYPTLKNLNLSSKLFTRKDLYVKRDDGEFLIYKEIPIIEFLKPGEVGYTAAVSKIVNMLKDLWKPDGILSILKKEKISN